MTKPNMLKLAAWKSRKNPEYREALRQLLKDARTEYRQRQLLERAALTPFRQLSSGWLRRSPETVSRDGSMSCS